MAETTTSNARLARQLTLRSTALRIRHTGMPQMVSMSRPVGVNPSSKNRGYDVHVDVALDRRPQRGDQPLLTARPEGHDHPADVLFVDEPIEVVHQTERTYTQRRRHVVDHPQRRQPVLAVGGHQPVELHPDRARPHDDRPMARPSAPAGADEPVGDDPAGEHCADGDEPEREETARGSPRDRLMPAVTRVAPSASTTRGVSSSMLTARRGR